MTTTKSDAAEQLRSPAAPFVVGIGASAGGIEALKMLFTHVPSDSGAAYVVILHMSPDHESRLADVLQSTAGIPVVQVTARVRMTPDCVYVVPPNKVLGIDRDEIIVSEMTRMEQRRAPVDLFFRSLADAQGSRATCVVLSGSGPNGSSGLKRIKEYGGLVIAQDPNEAEYEDMPRNSIATGLVDFVLPVAEIPARIRAFHDRLRGDGETAVAGAPATELDATHDILTLLRVRTGHDFMNYKSGTVLRRIERRLRLRGLTSMQAYARAMRENPDEAVALMKELLISVTNFFREPIIFDALADRVIPRLFLNKTSQDQVRVWVPACATGEEAYSIAMLLAEHAGTSVEQPLIQVFATDLDEPAIATAREALYTEAEVADVSQQRLQRFFAAESGGYRMRRELRETVLFAHHNVIKDPPFSHIDLISCRNLLIYLNRAVQQRVIETFHFSLRPGGFLFLGGSETPESTNDLFTVFDKAAHIYERRTGSRVSIPVGERAMVVPRMTQRAPEVRPQDRIAPIEFHQRLLEQYAPPSVVITEDHTVIHMSDTVGRYMHVTGGEPTRDLLRMVRPDLRSELRIAIYRAMQQRTTVEVKSVRVALADGEHRIDISVRPALRDTDPAGGLFLVTFAERKDPPAAKDHAVAISAEPIAEHLEGERARLEVQLRRTIDEYEIQADDAKAANDELQAMNEELRSAAEELETSKEELQSVNEELTTVNQELKIKIEELGLTNNDFQNLINSSDIGTIFLDRELRVKLSTPAANQIFNLLRSDVGRPLSDITSQLLYDNLHQDVQQVLEDLRTVDREVQTRNGRWTTTRIRPYRTIDNRIDGVVITFQDITDRRRAQERLRQGEERLRLLIDSAVDYAIFTMNTNGIIDAWNSGAERMFGYGADEIVGRDFEVLFTADDRAAGVPAAELRKACDTGRATDERFHVRKDGSLFYCSGWTTRLGEALGFAKIARDLSVQQQAQEALRVVQAGFEQEIRARTDKLEAELHASGVAQTTVRDLLKKLISAQEEERARIGRDLHDQLGQQLTALRLTLQRHRDQLGPSNGAPELDRALKLADELDREVDFLAWQIRPPVLDDLGLSAALPRFVRDWSSHYGISTEYREHGFAGGQLSGEAEVVFYRVAQEALNNVIKHAHATRVDVLLESRNGGVVLIVEDDGVGFDPVEASGRGIGLAGMRERAAAVGADLEIESTPGDGTSIFLRCAPIDAQSDCEATPS